MAMRTQQEAERAEQQRIKALVLNYDLRSGAEAEDESGLLTNGDYNNFSYITPTTSTPIPSNPNHARRPRRPHRINDDDNDDDTAIITKSENRKTRK